MEDLSGIQSRNQEVFGVIKELATSPIIHVQPIFYGKHDARAGSVHHIPEDLMSRVASEKCDDAKVFGHQLKIWVRHEETWTTLLHWIYAGTLIVNSTVLPQMMEILLDLDTVTEGLDSPAFSRLVKCELATTVEAATGFSQKEAGKTMSALMQYCERQVTSVEEEEGPEMAHQEEQLRKAAYDTILRHMEEGTSLTGEPASELWSGLEADAGERLLRHTLPEYNKTKKQGVPRGAVI